LTHPPAHPPLCPQPFHEAAKGLGLQRVDLKAITAAGDRRPKGAVWTTRALDAACADWQDAADAAAAAARARLRKLAADLEPRLHAVGLAASTAVLLQALMCHVERGLAAGWALPRLVGFPEAASPDTGGDGGRGNPQGGRFSGSGAGGGGSAAGASTVAAAASSSAGSSEARPAGGVGWARLELKGAWPYWMDMRASAEGSGREVVANDIELEGMALLTGPNMAGEAGE
jgi:hypothetical protein